MRHLRAKAWSASAAFHIAAATLAAIFCFERPRLDFITVQYAAAPLEIEMHVEFEVEQTLILDELLQYTPAEVVELAIEPPEHLLQKPAEDIDVQQIRHLVERSTDQAEQLQPEEQADTLERLLELDQALVSEKSASEITDLVKEARHVGNRAYDPDTPATMSEIDDDTVVPYYRITEQPSPVIEIIDLNSDGDYWIVKQKDLYELYDSEVDAYRKYMESAPEDLDAFLEARMKTEVKYVKPSPATRRHYRPMKKPKGRYFQHLLVDGAGRYRIMVEKLESEMTLLERFRLKAFSLTENPKHKQYREAVLGATGSDD